MIMASLKPWMWVVLSHLKYIVRRHWNKLIMIRLKSILEGTKKEMASRSRSSPFCHRFRKLGREALTQKTINPISTPPRKHTAARVKWTKIELKPRITNNIVTVVVVDVHSSTWLYSCIETYPAVTWTTAKAVLGEEKKNENSRMSISRLNVTIRNLLWGARRNGIWCTILQIKRERRDMSIHTTTKIGAKHYMPSSNRLPPVCCLFGGKHKEVSISLESSRRLEVTFPDAFQRDFPFIGKPSVLAKTDDFHVE